MLAAVEALLSVVAGDRTGLPPLDGPAVAALATAWAGYGLEVTEARPATAADVAASGSSWGRRLVAQARRVDAVRDRAPEALVAQARRVDAVRDRAPEALGAGGRRPVWLLRAKLAG